jgi:NHL repeat/RTX calcium-binding nonapeptide repeat (4 copies)
MRDRVGTYRRSFRSLATILVTGVVLALPSSAAATHTFVAEWGTPGSGAGELSAPSGIDTDSLDNVYVADHDNNRIQKYSADGELLATWGTIGSGNGQFFHPFDVAVGESGNIYVADRGNSRIQKFNSSGGYLAQWGSVGTDHGEFTTPSGVSTDAFGNVYVADWGNHRVQKFDSSGTFVDEWGSQGTGDGEFNNPSGIDVSDTTVYVTDFGNNRVQSFSTLGVFIGQFGSSGFADGEFSGPADVAVSAAGDVFVTDTGNSRVQQFTSGGVFTEKWGSLGAGAGQFNFIDGSGVAPGSLNTVFVVDTSNNRIQKFSAPQPNSTVRVSGTRLMFDATTAKSNSVTVSLSTGIYTVTDTDTLTPGAGCASVTANLATCTAGVVASVRIAVKDLDDIVTVNAATPAIVTGGSGDDTITGGVGSDVTASYSDATGAVTVSLAAAGMQTTGGAGSDTLTGVKSLTGSAFGDNLAGDTGANTLTGGGGNDRANYSSAPSAVTVDLSNTSAQATSGAGSDTLSSIEDLTGSAFNDVLTGSSVFNSILGGDGNDDIHVNDTGADLVGCGSGTDTVTADAQDTVDSDCETVTRTGAGTGGGGTPSTGGGGGPGGGGTVSAPVISGLSAPKLRSGGSGNFKYTLSTSASVTLTIERAGTGRKAGRLCTKQTRKNRKKPKCTFYSPVGKLTRAGVAGANTLRFAGKLAGRALKPGKYRVTAVATGATGARSGPVTAQFTVTK